MNKIGSSSLLKILNKYLSYKKFNIIIIYYAILVFSILFLISYIAYASLALYPGRSFWYDEFHIAWRLSEYGLFEVLINSFDENVGRMPAYMALNDVIATIYNHPFTLRSANFILYFLIVVLLLSFARQYGLAFSLTLILTVLVSDNFVQMMATFKPYVWDVAAILMALHFIGKIRAKNPSRVWTALLATTIAAAFTHIAWPLMAALCLWQIWVLAPQATTFQNTARFFINQLNAFKWHAVTITLIWIYLLQYIARYFLGGNETFFSYVAVEQSDSGATLQSVITTFFSQSYAIIHEFGVMSFSQDMPFSFVPANTAGIALVLFFLFVGSVFSRNRLVIVCLGAILISYIVSIFSNWPFDAERWSMAFYVFFAIPMAVSMQRLSHYSRMSAISLFIAFAAFQLPLQAHPNGTEFHNTSYQYTRLHPSTSTAEGLRWLDERIENLNVTLLGNFTLEMAFEYYVHSARVRPFETLRDTPRVSVSDIESLQNIVTAHPNQYYAFVNFHRLSIVTESLNWIERNCTILDELSHGDQIGDDRALRVKIVIFTCPQD